MTLSQDAQYQVLDLKQLKWNAAIVKVTNCTCVWQVDHQSRIMCMLNACWQCMRIVFNDI